jgi:hypothetical protein
VRQVKEDLFSHKYVLHLNLCPIIKPCLVVLNHFILTCAAEKHHVLPKSIMCPFRLPPYRYLKLSFIHRLAQQGLEIHP